MRIPDSDDTVYSSSGPTVRVSSGPGNTPDSTALWINPDFVQPVNSYKNMFINPSFLVNQRNAGVVTATNSYPADRWFISIGTSTVVSVYRSDTGGEAGGGPMGRTVSKSVDLPPGKKELGYDVSNAGDAANGYAMFGQDVEWTGLNDRPQVVTLSFWARDAASTDFKGKSVAIEYSTLSGTGGTILSNVPVEKINGISSAWKRISSTFVIPAFTGVTYPAVRFRVWLTAGTTYAQRASNVGAQTWTNGRFSSLQLERSPHATEFESRPYGVELELCQRWYWRFISSNSPENISQPYRRIGIGAHHPTSNSGVAYMPFPVTMVKPPLTWGAGGTNVWYWHHIGAGTGFIGYDSVAVDGVNWQQTTSGTIGTGRSTMLYINNANDTYNGMSAENVN